MQPKREDFPEGDEGRRQYKRAWHTANKPRIAAETKAWRENKTQFPTRPRPERCEVCLRHTKLVYDHNHATGEFRGWLCNPCNGLIGVYGDDPAVVERLLKYVRGAV